MFLINREPHRRPGDEQVEAERKPDEHFPRNGRDASPERVERRTRDRSVDRHYREHEKQFQISPPDGPKELFDNEDNRHRRDNVDGRGRREHRGEEYTAEHSSAVNDPHIERRPERLMRGRGDAYDQYTKTSGRRGEQEDYVEPDRFGDHINRHHLDPSSAVAKSARSRRKIESMLRNDSLSSDPSDCVRPPPPKPHKHKKGKKLRQESLSSSEEEIQTTPECTSCDEPEIESESVSEKGKH